jgi:hypothetical protein
VLPELAKAHELEGVDQRLKLGRRASQLLTHIGEHRGASSDARQGRARPALAVPYERVISLAPSILGIIAPDLGPR